MAVTDQRRPPYWHSFECELNLKLYAHKLKKNGHQIDQISVNSDSM